MQPDQDIPNPHQDWRGPRQQKPRELLRQVYKWAFPNLLVEPVATLAFCSHRLIDRTTGIPYSADELEAKILRVSEEYLENEFLPFVGITTETPVSLGSINLPAGRWDVSSHAQFIFQGADTTVCVVTSTNDINSVFEPGLDNTQQVTRSAYTGVITLISPIQRISLSTPTTYHVVAQADFTAGSVDAAGKITARRVS